MHILKDFISIDDLKARWGCDKKLIENFTYERDGEPGLIAWYAKETRQRPGGGQSAFVEKARYLNGCIFDMQEVLAMEKLHPELLQTGVEPKVVDGKFVFTESQLIKKEDLYKRWIGATDEEITKHFNNGALRVYCHYKGPINGTLWCLPGALYYQNQVSYTSPDLYRYDDSSCDYFLVEDVVKIEAACPEYIGNVTPESLGLIQTSALEKTDKHFLHAGLAILTAKDAINRLGVTPIEMVDILNGRDICDDHNNYIGTKRLVTVDEEAYREHANNGWSEKFFSTKALKNIKIYQIDLDRYCEEWGIQKQAQADTVDVPELEAQLAEAQAQNRHLRQWNKRLNEQNQELRVEISEKNALVASESDPPATAADSPWEQSTYAACMAVANILAEDMRQVVHGRESRKGADSAGQETLKAMINRFYLGDGQCRSKAVDAAWEVLKTLGRTHGGSRKTNL